MVAFQSAPLEADMEVTGPIDVVLWVSSSATDTDFTARLVDVCPANDDYPEGYHLPIADSILRARFREGFDHEELMTPGQSYRIRIELPPISNIFAAGHCIRVDIASSNFPRFDVNPTRVSPSAVTPTPFPPRTPCTWTGTGRHRSCCPSCLLSNVEGGNAPSPQRLDETFALPGPNEVTS